MSDRGTLGIGTLQRLTKLEVLVEAATAEIERIRDRVHDIANTTGTLQAESEEAAKIHQLMAAKIDRLTGAFDANGLASARTEAALGATLAAHIEQCKSDKAETRATLLDQNFNRAQLHEETHQRLARIERLVFIFVGGVLLVSGVMPWLLPVFTVHAR